MKLTDLLARSPEARLVGEGDREIAGITHDSRQVREGMIFAALPGMKSHGCEFLGAAVEAGAAAVLSDADPQTGCDLPWIRSARPRRDMAAMAWALAGDPRQLGPVYEKNRRNSDLDYEWMGQDIFDKSGISKGQSESRYIRIADARLARITGQRRCAPEHRGGQVLG